MSRRTKQMLFDYRALRLTIGTIAFTLPILVVLVSAQTLPSISASYYTNARDLFVGLLFVVGALMFAYNGHTYRESTISKIAALSAIIVALCPTACGTCEPDASSNIHYGAALVLFGILAYFCLGPFRKNTKGKAGKRGLRSKIYLSCGITMIACMASIVILPDAIIKSWNIVFWAEAIALGAFGVAWIVAGKYFRFLVDEDQALKIFN